MRSKRSKRWDNGVKARLITQLLVYDPDFQFEYACRGIHEVMQVYTQRQLKRRLNIFIPGTLLTP